MNRIGIEIKFKHGGESWRLIEKEEASVILEEWLDDSKFLMINEDILEKDLIQTIAFRNELVQ